MGCSLLSCLALYYSTYMTEALNLVTVLGMLITLFLQMGKLE